MRILITGTTYLPGLNGQAIFTVNLAEGLAKRGHEVLVAYPSELGSAYQACRNGVQLEAVKSVSLQRWHEQGFFTPFPGKDARRIFNSFKPEIVHIQDHYLLSRAFALLAQKHAVKLVGTNHYMPENLAAYVPWLSANKAFYNWLSWKWMLEVYNRLEIVTAQSQASAKLVQAAGLKVPLQVISCGIDTNRFRPDPTVDRDACLRSCGLDPSRKIMLFVGRVDQEKRLDVLLRALSLLDRQDIQFVITGRGAAFDDVHALAKALNLGDRVVFTGFASHDDLPKLLNSADFFTMPSEAELLSIATLEAMACGRPVLLADAVALPELVDNGVNGYLFKPGCPEDAARCIALLADQSDCWQKMGAASLTKAREHGLDNIIQKYERIYENSPELGCSLGDKETPR